MELEKLFQSINKKMLLDFNEISSQVKHRGAKGTLREFSIVQEYLRKYLPGNIGIARGEIFATNDHISSETDIVLFENNSTPYLLAGEGYQIFPIECVYGVIEIKSYLDKTSLTETLSKIRAIKEMPKVAYDKQRGAIIKTTNLYGKEWSYFPTIGLIIAFDSIDIQTLLVHYRQLVGHVPCEYRVDSIWILNKGMIVNYNKNEDIIELAPTQDSLPRGVISDNPLLMLTVQLQSLLGSAWMPLFQISKYLPNANYGKFCD